jgi:hypothetical protein
VQKDWDKGNTILGGMITSTHRWVNDPALTFLPTQAWSGGVDFTHYFRDRAWALEARGVVSRVEGDAEAIQALQTNAVHYFQRPDASHLGVDEKARSLSGNGGLVRFGRSGKGRFGVTDRFLWYSPGLDLNDIGYLRQADIRSNQLLLTWKEPKPKGLFRDYSFQLSRDDQWDFGGLATRATTSAQAAAGFSNKWRAQADLGFNKAVATRVLRGGPALRSSDFYTSALRISSDASRRTSASFVGQRDWFLEGGTVGNRVSAEVSLRPSNRVSLSAATDYVWLQDDTQYVATADTSDGPRWVIGRIAQDVWSLTVRVNVAIRPDLTLQYYGSPFIATGRYTDHRKATDTLSHVYEDRFHRYGPDEIAFNAPANSYDVTETGGTRFSFANADFSFRQFRSNLVARWEWKPGSSLYVVWSQGRTGAEPTWEDSFNDNWRALWSAPADNVFLVKLSYWFSP